VAGGAEIESVVGLTCPHCHRPFEAALLGAKSVLRGFKCPHCRLFVPAARADADAPPARARDDV
jgi:hypothetical protein